MRRFYSTFMHGICAFFPRLLNFHKVLGLFSGRSMLKCKVFWRDSEEMRG